MALKIFFGSLAQDYVKESGREIQDVAAEIAKSFKTSPNQFSKWKSGTWTYIPERKLVRIIEEIAGRDRLKRIHLMIAYLIDQTPDVFRPLIAITPVVGDAAGDPGLGSAKQWSPSLRRKIEAIGAAYMRDNDFMRMADQLGVWAESINKRADEAGSASTLRK